eukprot:CAMPEP_0184022868 /NCGR_PEP_ID=MMETSP0954-20121128/10929_1 /TAXON_ID=627963 /ORGANISM="Aplanochytrium sp, Strain PBS07" /LENGTH=83 /DNA_ID=CAMNT_0026305459 /DNA_START=13 /DNA_END=261 /DNA_ORIENTATION=+
MDYETQLLGQSKKGKYRAGCPGAVVSWGFGGKIVTAMSGNKQEVKISNIGALLQTSKEAIDVDKVATEILDFPEDNLLESSPG